MADETKRIQPTHGPYANTQIDLPTADAESAISEGWAIDPFAPLDPDAKPKELTAEDHEKLNAAANKAARKFRGEETEEEVKKAKPAASRHADRGDDDKSTETTQRSSDRSSDAGSDDATYQTRRAAPAAKPGVKKD